MSKATTMKQFKREEKRNARMDKTINNYLAKQLLERNGFNPDEVVSFTMHAGGEITVVSKEEAVLNSENITNLTKTPEEVGKEIAKAWYAYKRAGGQ